MKDKKPTALIGVTGGIAAVKIPALVRLFTQNGWNARCVMTSDAARFVTPLSLSVLSGAPALESVFPKEAYEMPHLNLSREADVMIVAPATAAILGAMAHGISGDMVTLCYLTTTAPVLAAPAMHDTMWNHPAVQDNVTLLKKRGVTVLNPVKGKLADNSVSEGRMVEPEDIFEAARKALPNK